MSCSKWLTSAVIITAIVGCADDRSAPTAPSSGGRKAAASSTVEEEQIQRLARTFALALHNPAFRARVRSRLNDSPYREHKVHFQGLLTANNHQVLTDLARESGAPENQIQEDAANSLALELYLPVPAHRASWVGDEDILVATALGDRDVPVAFDTRGRRYTLDPDQPPTTPVLALVPVETDFSRLPAIETATCTLETCPPTGGGTGGSGGGATGSSPAPGIHMSYSHMTQSFEGWLKGDPEFEVHILGQYGQTDSLKDYQCAGEHAGGPYAYDQNGLDWTGDVLLFSQTQLDTYKTQHPGQSIRIFIVEDDDTACDIRNGAGTMENILAVVDAAYNAFTGGKDTTTSSGKYLKKAKAFQNFLAKLAALIKTNDELVGDAIEDNVVGQYYTGANWIVKGENNVTNGWLKLEMK